MYSFPNLMGFPGGSDGKTSACNVGDPGSIPGSGRSLEKEMATHSNILAWKIHGLRSLVGYTLHGVAHDFAPSLSLFPIWNQSVVPCPVLLLLDLHTDF